MRVRIRYLRDAREVYEKGLSYATEDAAGLDLRACPEQGPEEIVILPGERLSVPSGIAVEPLAKNVMGLLCSRSGLGALRGLTVAQGTGVIDADYRGEITVVLLNTSREKQCIRRGDRIAQLLFLPVVRAQLEEVTELGSTDRGEGGFGHTGR